MEAGLFTKLVQNYLGPAAPGQTLVNTLETVANPDCTSEALGPVLSDNQAYAQLLLRMDFLQERLNQWAEDEPPGPHRQKVFLERTIGLLGRLPVRNSVACIQLLRTSGAGLPRKPKDTLVLNPREQLKYALLAEETCQNQNLAFVDQAYAAGFHYDLLNALMTARKAPKDAKTALENAWNDAIKIAQISYAIATLIKSFKYDRFAFGAGLLLPTGKILAQLVFTKEMGDRSWGAFIKNMDAYKKDREWANLLFEKKAVPFCHNELAALFVSFAGFFKPVEKSISSYSEPYFLKGVDKDLYTLSAILSLASSLVPHWNAIVVENPKTGSLPISNAKRKLVKDLKATDSLVLQAVQRVIKGGKP